MLMCGNHDWEKIVSETTTRYAQENLFLPTTLVYFPRSANTQIPEEPKRIPIAVTVALIVFYWGLQTAPAQFVPDYGNPYPTYDVAMPYAGPIQQPLPGLGAPFYLGAESGYGLYVSGGFKFKAPIKTTLSRNGETFQVGDPGAPPFGANTNGFAGYPAFPNLTTPAEHSRSRFFPHQFYGSGSFPMQSRRDCGRKFRLPLS